MSPVHRTAPVVSLALAALAACTDLTPPSEPAPPIPARPSASIEEQDAVVRPHEAEFHKLAEAIPGFGGYFFDEEGNLVAYLADPAQEDRALQLLQEVAERRAAAEREKRTGRVLFRKADFAFAELSAWRDRSADDVLDTEGVEYVDLDEEANRLVVGLTDGGARDGVAKALEGSKVPGEAVLFEEAKPTEELLTLQDYHRPLEGGYQIETSVGRCTLGFNAYWSDRRAFLTNSHCTKSFWANDGVSVYQNVTAAANLAGAEVHDPAPLPCGAWLLYRCRWSDAAVIRTNAGVPANHGYIARTLFWGFGWGNAGSLTVNPNDPRMRIVGEYSFPVGGEMFDKMGRTTGWTYGFVRRTCVDHNKGGNLRLRCQDWIRDMYAWYGDSGSPIFRWHGRTVTLAGILWGKKEENGRNYIVMSAMWNIEKDLGSLGTF